MDRIPIEIFDCILNELHPPYWGDSTSLELNGKADLDACTLVSRSWAELAQRHLFRDITYSFRASHDGPDIHKNGAFGLITPFRSRTLPMLLEFLQQSPRFKRYIHRLTLDLWPQSRIPGLYRRGGSSAAWHVPTDVVDYDVLVTFLHSLPNLDSLRLYNMNTTEQTSTSLPPNRLRLSHFSISNKRDTYSLTRTQSCASSSDFSRLLDLVGAAKELSAAWVKRGEEPSRTIIPIETENLIFSLGDRFIPQYAASKYANLSGVRRVIWGSPLAPLSYFQEVISNIGPQLVELRASFNVCYPPEPVSGRVPIIPFVDLSSCNKLESFTLGLRGALLRGSHGLLSASDTTQSLPHSPLRLRELCVALRFTLMGHRFDLRKWISENAEPIRLLEESLMMLMDRCSPPLEYLILRPKLFRNMAGTGGGVELDMTPFVREMFPRLEETGRIRIRPLFPGLWQTFQVGY